MTDQPSALTVVTPFGAHAAGDRIADADAIALALASHSHHVVPLPASAAPAAEVEAEASLLLQPPLPADPALEAAPLSVHSTQGA